MTAVTSNILTHDPGTLGLHTEVSTLEGNGGKLEKFLQFHSAKTGQVAEFQYADISKDREGDVLFWTYRPTAMCLQKNPRLVGYTLTIWND